MGRGTHPSSGKKMPGRSRASHLRISSAFTLPPPIIPTPSPNPGRALRQARACKPAVVGSMPSFLNLFVLFSSLFLQRMYMGKSEV